MTRTRLQAPASAPALAGNVLASLLLGFGLPLGVYVALNATGHPTSTPVFALALAGVIADLVLVIISGITILGMRRRTPDAGHPPASALVLTGPESAPRAVEATVRTLLGMEYRFPVQIVVACCRREQSVALEDLRWQHGHRLDVVYTDVCAPPVQMRAALPYLRGQVVGVFCAGQHPFPDAFTRAWFWLVRGCAAVGGGDFPPPDTATLPMRIEAIEHAAAGVVPPRVYRPEEAWRACAAGNVYLPTDLLRRISGSDAGTTVAAIPRRSRLASWSAYCRRRLQGEIDLHLTPLSAPRARAAGAAQARSLELPGRVMPAWHAAYAWLSSQVLVSLILVLVSPHSGAWLLPLAGLLLLYVVGTNLLRAGFAFAAAPPALALHRRWFVEYALLSAVMHRGLVHALARAAQLRIMAAQATARTEDEAFPAHDDQVSAERLEELRKWLLRVSANQYNVPILTSIADDAPALGQLLEACRTTSSSLTPTM